MDEAFLEEIRRSIIEVKMHTAGMNMPDPNSRIWRYMKVDHLRDLLYYRRLYFARADTVSDINEGQLPKSIRETVQAILPHVHRDRNLYSVEELMKQEEKGLQQYKRAIFLNCWHLEENETKERWRHHSDKVVAIQSTYLKLELASYEKRRKRYEVSAVNYIDHDNDFVSQQHPFTIYIQKASKYAFERELRAITFSPNPPDNGGMSISMNLESVLEQIVISPNVDASARSEIRSIVVESGLNIPIRNSRFT
ncbi:MAG TPA: hypothetical protein VGQ03_05890 [Nitrososphaera sp.]|nr:hypothetical protein [Nitrososphaera sp.]